METAALNPSGTITAFFNKLQLGEHHAAEPLWDAFFPRLLRLARRTVSTSQLQAVDADDIVQSAFVTFWQQTEKGDFGTDLDRDQLWKLLATITVRKALGQLRRENARKRGGGAVTAESALRADGDRPFKLDQTFGQIATQDFDLMCEERLLSLDEDVRAVAILKLTGRTNSEIASELSCTVRRVERKLALIRSIWQHDLTRKPV